MQFSEKAVETIKSLYEDAVYAFLDDPLPDDDSEDEALRPTYERLVELGGELGLDFWKVAIDGGATEYEKKRLREFLEEEGVTIPAHWLSTGMSEKSPVKP